ncbi:MAG: exodeoxyribonuclease VII large subunit [Anaerovoracaceae bacterium]|jgi:exodeoxyribonuclease VII large subunit
MEVRVSKLTEYISDIFRTDPILRNIGVVGEISNLKYHSSGVFFTLKDGDAAIRCIMWREYADLLRYELEDGMEVKAFGGVQIYAKGGTYSLMVKDVEVSGEGGLMAAYKALYSKLSEEGMFDKSHKKPLPAFPSKVGVVTSGTGAAVQDILKIIRNRNDIVDVLVYPVLVQGEYASKEIADAIKDINKRFTDVDVLIVGRGGGSIEDLWAFNEERTARAVYESKIPVISAVGHESDFVITDFAADVRAATPTAAAAIAVPDIRDVRKSLEDLSSGLRSRLDYLCTEKSRAVERCSPESMMLRLRNRYKFDIERLASYTPQRLSRLIQSRCDTSAAALGSESEKLHTAVRLRISERENALEKMRIMLEGADPERIVRRGYAIVTDENGSVVSDAAGLARGDLLNVKLRDGTAVTEVRKTEVDANGR